MALIQCPQCGGQISDKAAKCIHCGTVLKEEAKTEIFCSECGTAISENDEICPVCGCPVENLKIDEPQKVEVTNVRVSVDKKSKKSIMVVLLIAVIVVVCAIAIKYFVDKNTSGSYGKKLAECVSVMYSGAVKAEAASGLIHDVWYNTIYEKDDYTTDEYTKDSLGYFNDDFNTSLMVLMIDEDFTSDITEIENNQTTVQKLMKELKNPPEEYKEAYDDLKEFYDAYTRLVSCATDPSGNLNSYTSECNEADTDTANCYKAMKMYLEE